MKRIQSFMTTEKINDAEYVQRINDQGEIEEVYAPVVSSKNEYFETNESDKTWWTKSNRVSNFCINNTKGFIKTCHSNDSRKIKCILLWKKTHK